MNSGKGPGYNGGGGGKSRGRMSRVQMGLLVAAVFFGTALLGGWLWSFMVALSIYFGQRELRTIMGASGIRPSQIIISTAAVLMLAVSTLNKPQFLSPILTLTIIASFFRLIFRSPRATISDIGGTLIAVFYVVFLPVHYILLRDLALQTDLPSWQQPGVRYLLMTLVVISASDVFAYYVGKQFGKHLLSPEISPKKTREGAYGGLLAGVLFGLGFFWLWPPLGFNWVHALILSGLLVVVGQLGDLAESLMKRDSGIKDSGVLLASHGGFLDRADSYLFSGAVCYYYIYWIVLQQGLAPDVIQWLNHFR